MALDWSTFTVNEWDNFTLDQWHLFILDPAGTGPELFLQESGVFIPGALAAAIHIPGAAESQVHSPGLVTSSAQT